MIDTLAAIREHGWRCILLHPRRKRPKSRKGTHHATKDAAEIEQHLADGGNVGICAGTHAALDFDKPGAALEMSWELGPLPPATVETGSGKLHFYIAHEPDLPAILYWRGERVGEILRLPTQYAVAPPSVHPCGGTYRWLVDPREPLPSLLPEWRQYLTTPQRTYDEPWNGPPADALIRLAEAQPNAQRRGGKISFRCAGCAAEGHDRKGEHAVVFDDGRWTCVVDPSHRGAISAALGVWAKDLPTTAAVAGVPREWVRGW